MLTVSKRHNFRTGSRCPSHKSPALSLKLRISRLRDFLCAARFRPHLNAVPVRLYKRCGFRPRGVRQKPLPNRRTTNRAYSIAHCLYLSLLSRELRGSFFPIGAASGRIRKRFFEPDCQRTSEPCVAARVGGYRKCHRQQRCA